MTHTIALTASERCARNLLSAWNSGELARLQAVLDSPAVAEDCCVPSSERERIELVQEIAGGIRMWLRGVRRKNQTDLNASLRLLRHLARCESVEGDPWGTETSASSAA